MPQTKRETRGMRFVASDRKYFPSSPRSNCTGTSSSFKEPCFESGVGFGALYMLISSQQEFQRLNNLLEQTEALVQQMKRHLQHHGRKLETSSCSKSPNTYFTEIKTVSEQGLLNYNDKKESLQKCSNTRKTIDGWHMEDHDPMRKGMRNKLDGSHMEDQSFMKAMMTEQMVENCEMSALEVELEAELELLEFNLNFKEACLEQAVAYDSSEGYSKEVIDIEHNDSISHKVQDASDLNRRGRQSTHLGALSVDYAVSPFELDRRLREVLEAQKTERILELEELLRETMTTLHSKEEEILFWKNCVCELTKSSHPSSEFTKAYLEVLGTFQDPPISSQITHVKNSRSPLSFAEMPKQRKCLSSSAVDVTTEVNKLPLFISELSDPPSFEESVDLVKVVTESHTSWHIQGAGIDTPETIDRSMGEIEVHTPLPMIPQSFRSQSVSRSSERSDYFQQDDLNSVASPSCWDLCDQGNSAFTNSNNTCLHYTSFCSSSSSSKDMPCIEENGNVRTKETSDVRGHPCLEPLKQVLKGCSSRYQVMEDSSSGCTDSKFMRVEERNCSNANKTVDSGTSDLQLNSLKRLHSRTQSTLNVAAETARGSSKMKHGDLQVVTTGLRRSFDAEDTVGITSPVLCKIRHWEALGRGQSLENCTPDIMKIGSDDQNVWKQ